MDQLAGKVALVTGASRGIGRAIAESLAKQGARVVGTATSQSGADGISDYLSKYNGKGLVLNVSEQSSLDATLADIKAQMGDIDILINNAGITRDNLLMRMKDNEWDDIINTNLTPIFKLTKAVLRGMMKKRYGRIVNIGSVVGSTGNPGQANYAAAKAGVIGFSKSTAREVASRGITVNVVAPGFIDTDMTKSLTADQKDAIFKDIPANRLGSPEEVAATVSFLVSDSAAYITGETIHVNGGMYMG
ncbi:3-oxoacyl-ACP reductase FabG [Aliiglaciecola sp. LCG003]|uniref:3-oxoacyl-ACP reductase FabG n=1 Tax=Aliiglaciecola sp. LCG003 TaxID=3053655 RepID=UPI002573EA61|nr:3-oxoacyl-ACP reductase FabG [Aliiglaciecola sp. LCG003]WJG07743.1 3-oxoacyl-ACP reductase FabG [Aliiglaciecola sp. LCG003]